MNQPKFSRLTLDFSAFYRLCLEIALFRTKPSAQIFLCHVTDVKCHNFFVYCIMTQLIVDDPEFQEFLLNTRQGRNFGVKSIGTKVDF